MTSYLLKWQIWDEKANRGKEENDTIPMQPHQAIYKHYWELKVMSQVSLKKEQNYRALMCGSVEHSIHLCIHILSGVVVREVFWRASHSFSRCLRQMFSFSLSLTALWTFSEASDGTQMYSKLQASDKIFPDPSEGILDPRRNIASPLVWVALGIRMAIK